MTIAAWGKLILDDRALRRALIAIAVFGLAGGLAARAADNSGLADLLWSAATIPVATGLLISIVRDLTAGRLGVDAIALLAMAGALALGQPLAGCVIALMYSGGNLLEDIAVARAEHDLRALIDRAPRTAHREKGRTIEDVSVTAIAIGDKLLVRAGEIIPVDGVIGSDNATIDASAVTGEPIPVLRRKGASVSSGTLNAGDAFVMTASSTAGESTYAGILRLVNAAHAAKAPFVRLADRYALFFLPLTLMVAGAAWLFSGDIIRGLAVLVAATPCPLILAAPVAFISGVARAARRGILIKGGAPLEALARAYTVLFDKTGTLTIGGARLISIEVAPNEHPDEVLRLCASLEQASHHVVAAAIVTAAIERDLPLTMPKDVRETPGSGLTGLVEGKQVVAGSYDIAFGHRELDAWASRATRRAAWRSALVVFLAIDDRPAGALLLADELRAETPRAIRTLRTAGVARIGMITGDRAAAAQTIGAALDLDVVLADRGPSDKVDAVRPSSSSILLSWSATESTMRQRWRRPMSVSRWAPAAPAPPRRLPMS